MKMSKRTATHRKGKWRDLGPLISRSRSLNEDNTVRSISFSAGEYTFELSLTEALSISEDLTRRVDVLVAAQNPGKWK